nr:hypothetical protein [uncultured Desulfuromonas sp.]
MPKDVGEKFRAFAMTHNYARRINAAETHWYFIEGAQAFHHGLYLASSLSFLNGIESSIRALLMYIDQGFENDDLVGPTFSNRLLRDAQKVGLNVEILAFDDEPDFLTDIQSNKPNVKIVQTRHNLCHGNVFEYIEDIPVTNDRIFTPNSLYPLASKLRDLGEAWSKEIERFKRWAGD